MIHEALQIVPWGSEWWADSVTFLGFTGKPSKRSIKSLWVSFFSPKVFQLPNTHMHIYIQISWGSVHLPFITKEVLHHICFVTNLRVTNMEWYPHICKNILKICLVKSSCNEYNSVRTAQKAKSRDKERK